jgi:hypothetical protein
MFNVYICDVLISTTMKLKSYILNKRSKFAAVSFALFFNFTFFGQEDLSSKEYSDEAFETFVYNDQNIILNDKLVENFGFRKLNEIKQIDIDRLLYLNHFVEFSYSIRDIGIKALDLNYSNFSSCHKKPKSLALDFVPSNHSSFNILAYDILLRENQQVIITNNESEAIIVLCKKDYLAMYNNYRNHLLNK